jgi:uncharacterized membrane protein
MASVIEKWQGMRIRHSHRHPPIININKAHDERLTFGQRAADSLASAMGSWMFISIQSVVLVIWIALNIIGWIEHWDPYPFILLNLALSFQAAYAAPIIMMSQNRLAAKDRLMAEEDYRINSKAEEELKAVMRHLETQDEMMLDLLHRLEEQHQQIISRIAAPAPQSEGTQA